MADWSYGKAGDEYPSKLGDLWVAGQHVLGCGDLDAGHGSLFLRQIQPKPMMVYVDPPYNLALAKGYRTKIGMDASAVDFDALIARILLLCADVGLAFIETGKASGSAMERLFVASGANCFGRWGITYYRKNPALLFGLTWGERTAPDRLALAPLEGMDDEHTPGFCIEKCSKPGDIVFDPCTGRGGTARHANRLCRAFAGMELNTRRLACAIKYFANRGIVPQRAGQFI